jgi:hypothetical protein
VGGRSGSCRAISALPWSSVRVVGERLADRLDRLARQAELETGKRGEALRGLDLHLALDGDTRGGCAEEEAGVQGDLGQVVGIQRLDRALQLEGEALGLEVLDQEGDLGQGRGLGVAVGRRAPGAAHGGAAQVQRRTIAAEALILRRRRPCSTPSGRLKMKVIGRSETASALASRTRAVSWTVSPGR